MNKIQFEFSRHFSRPKILVFKTIDHISMFLFEVARLKRALFALSRLGIFFSHLVCYYFFMFTYVVTGDFGVQFLFKVNVTS